MSSTVRTVAWSVVGALIVALAIALSWTDRGAGDVGEEAGYWRAIAEARLRTVAALTASRDSAIAAVERDTVRLVRATGRWEPARIAVVSDRALAADPRVTELVAAGDSVVRACTDLRRSCDRAIALARAVGDSAAAAADALQRQLDAISRIRQPRFNASIEALWDFAANTPVIRGDVDLRIREHVYAAGSVDHRVGTALVPGETRRLVGLSYRFR
jgi:hypothetical protein